MIQQSHSKIIVQRLLRGIVLISLRSSAPVGVIEPLPPPNKNKNKNKSASGKEEGRERERERRERKGERERRAHPNVIAFLS